MKKYLFFIFLFLVPLFLVRAELLTPTGIISSNVWFSKEKLNADDSVKIYTALWNGEKEELKAKIEFYDENVLLGMRDISVSPDQIKEVSVIWKVTSGDHVIYAKIISSSLNNNSIILNNNQTEKSRFFVPVLIKGEEGNNLTTSGVIKNKIEKTGENIENVISDTFSDKKPDFIKEIDLTRSDFSDKIIVLKNQAEKDLKLIKENKETNESNTNKESLEKPLAQVKLFSLQALSFILETKIVFYFLLIIIVLMILRSIYRFVSGS